MSVDTSDWGVTTADDTFHRVNPAEPRWTETVWMSWHVPERGLFGNFYPVFRPNLGVQFGGVTVYDPSGDLPWTIPVHDQQWHLQMQDIDLRDAKIDNDMYLRAIEPNRVFEFGYASDELQFELRFEALMRPLVSGGESDLFSQGGHLDQPGHVTGWMNLQGEQIPVDCFAQRDRAWGPRRDNRQPQVAYCYGTASATDAFLAISAIKRRGDDDAVFGGYNMHDGVWAKMKSGLRTVERDDQGAVVRVHIEAVDELGRDLNVRGETVSRLFGYPYPSMLCINSLTRWELNGVECWGEDQDAWPPRRWRDYRTAERAKITSGR
ncbi:MAG: hypothetical protein JWM76_4389 [Pseudonocardiales bacterium]|nr:hypothetical protein [Pseudonocardiales bacterium]